MKHCFKLAILIITCLFGLIQSGNLIPDSQNPILITNPSTNNNLKIDVRFSFDINSPGLAYYQYIGLVFPPNVSTDLQFDLGNRYSCELTDGTLKYTMVAEKPLPNENNIAYCRLSDMVNNVIKSFGLKLKLSVTLVGIKISSNFVRSFKVFTSTTNKNTKIIIDQLSFAGNVALYADPSTFSSKALDVTSSSIIMSGSNTINNIYPYQTFDVSVNIKSNIFIAANDYVISFKYSNQAVNGCQSAISNSLNIGTTNDPMSGALKGTLTVTSSTAGDSIILGGITEDLVPNRQFQIVLKSWKAKDLLTNTLSTLDMVVYYKNTYSVISQSQVSTSFFKISYASINLTVKHLEGWDIFRNGVFPLRFSFTSQQDLSNGGYVVIQQNNTVDLQNRFNFVASTCDFSENDNNFSQEFGKRVQCYPLRTDFNYPNTSGSQVGYNGSGIFFYMPSVQSGKTNYVTVWGSADACGGTSSKTDFASSVNPAGTFVNFSFKLTFYKLILSNEKNEERFSITNILGQSETAAMPTKCWNTMTQLVDPVNSPAGATTAPSLVPFHDTLYTTLLKVTDSVTTLSCTPASDTKCRVSDDINLYREFFNIKLINHTSSYASGLYFVDLINQTTSKGENFLYGSNTISSTSYFAVTFNIPYVGDSRFYEFFPSPILYDAATGGTPATLYRYQPGRLEFKVQKKWFTVGEGNTRTSGGCYLSWGINRTNSLNIMKKIITPNASTDCSSIDLVPNHITAYQNYSSVGGATCGTATDDPMIDIDNTQLPTSSGSNQVLNSYKIVSLWNSGKFPPGNPSAKDVIGSGYDGRNNFGWPVPRPVMNTKLGTNPTVAGTATSGQLVYAIFTSCLKWNTSVPITSLYTALDIQMNYLFTIDQVSLTNAVPHRAIRLIKLFPEGGVFQSVDSTVSGSRLATANANYLQTGANISYKLHFSTGANNISVGVCLIEIYGQGLSNASDSNSSILAIWIGFGVILEQDYTQVSSNYPVAGLSSTTYMTYGLQSGYFMNSKENWNVLNKLTETNVYEDDASTSAKYLLMNRLPLRNLLAQYAFSGFEGINSITDKFNSGGTVNVLETEYGLTQYGGRSSYLFLMGSVVFITGISGNSITSNTNADNLLIPIYCPIHDTTSAAPTVGTIKHFNGLPTLYMAYLTMSSYSSITSVNKIFNHTFSSTSANVLTIITPTNVAYTSGDYYRDSDDFTNAGLFGTTTPQNYLVTLRWATYTSAANLSDNTLYMYYGNASGLTTTPVTNGNCTGHVWLINSSITIDTTNLAKSGYTDTQLPSAFNGTKKFYYLGFEFSKSVMMGLGSSKNAFATSAPYVGALTPQALTSETSVNYLTGIKRPIVDTYYSGGEFKNAFDSIGYFCNSANKSALSKELYSNYLYMITNTKKTFAVDFNPPKDSPKVFTVTMSPDKTETVFKSDIAGNVKINMTLPYKIPGGLSINFYSTSTSFTPNTLCGLYTTATQPVIECSFASSSLLTCLTNRSDVQFTICCYNVTMVGESLSLATLNVSVPASPSTGTRFNTEILYDAVPATNTISWTTGQNNGTDILTSTSAKITKVEYSQVIQDSGIGKITYTITLAREPARNMAISISGDFAAMAIQNVTPRCLATFGNTLGANWELSGDILLESCNVSNFIASTNNVVVTTKNIVYKCGLSFSSKTLYIMLWPIVQLNWSISPNSSNVYKVAMTLNNASSEAIAYNPSGSSITTNISYSAKPGFAGQWDNLCAVSSVVPRIAGEYADYTFEFDLDTNKSALTSSAPNEVSIFFPYNHYGATIPQVLCFYNNTTMNCSFTDEGILNVRFTTNLPVGSGKKIVIVITGIYNPSFDSDIYFPCTINNTNFSTGLRKNLITGSGKLSSGFTVASGTVQGALRFINSVSVTDFNPRNVSTHNFKVSFDSAINLSSTPITISNTPQIIITFPQDYNLNWYNTVKATATIDEYTNDGSNIIVKGNTITPASVTQSGNRITITLSTSSYTFNTNWRYWDIKVSQITGPTDSTSSSNNTSTSPFNVIITNSNYSSIYRTYTNLNNSSLNTLTTQVDSLITQNRGIDFKFDNTKWVIDINTSGVFNKLTIRPGRFILSTFTIKSNTSSFIQPRTANISFSDQVFRLADTIYSVTTAYFQPITFYIGAPCGTAPGNYIVNFNLSGENVNSFFAPLAPVQISLDASTTGVANFSTPSSIPKASSTLIYYSLSEPNVDTLIISWTSSETTKNDPTATVSSTTITGLTIPAGTQYVNNNKMFSTFLITNSQATSNQIFKPNTLNSCYTWSSNELIISISGEQAIIPNQYDFTSQFKYFNSETDSSIIAKNSIKFNFTPPYSPIYVYCALVCFNKNYPSDDNIRSATEESNTDNLTRYYSAMFNSKTAADIVFNNLVRGQRYKLRCIISSTEGNVADRTSASVSVDQLTSTNGTTNQFLPSSLTKTQCVQYYFTSDPGQSTKIAMINYCQKLYSANGWSQSGCIICTDSGLTYTSPGISLPANLTCTASAAKTKLRFLQTTNSTVTVSSVTPTTAGSTVNPSLVNQSNPITFSICPVQHPVCPSDVSGNKLYSDYFNQLITDTRTTALFNTNLGIVNVPVNNTLIVNDNVVPDISKNFVVSNVDSNPNGFVRFSATHTSALRCSWQITETSAAPTTGAQVDGCTDTQWCGKNFYVGTLPATASTNAMDPKPFTAGKTYGLYMACFNDVPYSTSISGVSFTPLSIPNNSVPTTPTNPTTPVTPTGSEYSYFSYGILLILALLI